ncbi:TusE/DsrC/DsvC family sulfur relay protein [Aestuariirhabdus sp. Z084]|uniref:TusE/DsrC/DsvC family sulfur relay protein n=1 Tax=Aestuariirhabdus haliotis TaxID=2918751 RepID=UPI00201B3A62|nr:TusE/DsrC/DsvC family sulfur relay protein [Aestuariirhabdus haliotis]MCL6414876.1 TusE/DsrC/DsvC family sulfur relay protein [Aestuariirhabdus haliotis]MCL6418808.1 TusE/DsrC/DsvC family sulfur relay protein [Aestuariirhabdus haliotis]
MPQIIIDGKSVEVDKEGYLTNLDDWSPNAANELALADDISLSDAHWEVIHALRAFYSEYQLSPAMRPLVKYIGRTLGNDKGKSIYLLQLFPGSPAKIAARIAGLPKPTNCM